jgi:hypothetical protein
MREFFTKKRARQDSNLRPSGQRRAPRFKHRLAIEEVRVERQKSLASVRGGVHEVPRVGFLETSAVKSLNLDRSSGRGGHFKILTN